MAGGDTNCPACRSDQTTFLMQADGKDYYACSKCQARYLARKHLPRADEEYAHYLTHENDPDDPGYRAFLSKLAIPLLNRVAPGAIGLDYGCGPGPALAAMLEERGHQMALYDPFFSREPAPLGRTYDFITCTETAEHFHRPADEFDRLDNLLRPGGLLAVMTSFQTDDARFEGWHYRKDPTHVVFYREATFRVIALQRGWSCTCPVKDVVLMFKPGRPQAGRNEAQRARKAGQTLQDGRNLL
ncbi:MAG: class I SAM-dependent methyltransferase [Pseudomonadota bacterium]